jgi:hypothetical protein
LGKEGCPSTNYHSHCGQNCHAGLYAYKYRCVCIYMHKNNFVLIYPCVILKVCMHIYIYIFGRTYMYTDTYIKECVHTGLRYPISCNSYWLERRRLYRYIHILWTLYVFKYTWHTYHFMLTHFLSKLANLMPSLFLFKMTTLMMNFHLNSIYLHYRNGV